MDATQVPSSIDEIIIANQIIYTSERRVSENFGMCVSEMHYTDLQWPSRVGFAMRCNQNLAPYTRIRVYSAEPGFY